MLVQALRGFYGKGATRVRLSPNGEFSQNLAEGVARVKVPDEWDSVGGIVPDLI